MDEPKIAYSRISSEYDGMRHYDKEGKEIKPNPLAQNVGVYKPTYDVEVSGKPWSFSFTFDVYADVYTRIAHLWFPFYWGGHLLVVLPLVALHKLWRKISA